MRKFAKRDLYLWLTWLIRFSDCQEECSLVHGGTCPGVCDNQLAHVMYSQHSTVMYSSQKIGYAG